MGKLVEKVVAQELSQSWDTYLKLYEGQIGVQKSKCVVDIVTIMVDSIRKI